MRYLALLLLLPLLANADQNCWISVTTVDADEVKQAVEEKLAAEKPAEEKGVIEEIIEVIKGEPVALSAQKIEAADVLQKTPKDSTAFFRRPTLKGDERQLVSVYTDTVEEAQKVTAGYDKAELLGVGTGGQARLLRHWRRIWSTTCLMSSPMTRMGKRYPASVPPSRGRR